MAEMREPVILEAVRTPFAKAGGAFRDVRPDRLLARTLDGLLERTGLDAEKVEDVINGTVTQAGEQGANIGRLGVMLAGIPVTVPAVSLNRMCGSSQQAAHFASQAVVAGDIGYAIASGAESMTRALMFSDTGDGTSGFEVNPDLLKNRTSYTRAKGPNVLRKSGRYRARTSTLSPQRVTGGRAWRPVKARTRRSYPPQVSTPRITR